MQSHTHQITITITHFFNKARCFVTAFWRKYVRIIAVSLALAVLAIFATVLFIRLWRRSQVFRTVVLITTAAIIANLNGLMYWLTGHTSDLIRWLGTQTMKQQARDTASQEASLVLAVTYLNRAEETEGEKSAETIASDPALESTI